MNAIILAAGMGTRLRPLTADRPKALVEIAGESFFARQVRQLRAAGIDRIAVVTGYESEAFRPWHGQDGLEFVHNEHFADRNNIWSMYLVHERLGDTVVLDGDLRLAEGIIPSFPPSASGWYVGWREDAHDEWIVRTDPEGRVRHIDVASGSGWVLTGLSYWTSQDGGLLSGLLGETMARPGWEQLYWDEIPRRALDRIDARARRLEADAWAEIDSLEEKIDLEARLASAAGARSGSETPYRAHPTLDAQLRGP
ncbi:MAG: NTP transferase domain-containing protein [Rectinemataceae bacterium]